MAPSEFAYESSAIDSTSEIQEGELEVTGGDDSTANAVSEEYVGKWERLISTTNWEKGRIILEWRQALVDAESPSTSYSDDAWSKRVGGVTSQHVGRLRRTYERFGATQASYRGIYWSHFLAALDWDDAEMWLEGASQSRWSISDMREQRWLALGGKPETKPRHEDFVGGVVDEDYEPLSEVESGRSIETDPESDDRIGTTGPLMEGPDFGDDQESSNAIDHDDLPFDVEAQADGPQINPFASLPVLPTDVAEALEQFKLAIVRHRASSWVEIQQEEMLRVVDALRQFVMSRPA